MTCRKCGAPIGKKSAVCAYCGEPVPDSTTAKLVICVLLVAMILFLLIWYSGQKPAVSPEPEVFSTVVPETTAPPDPPLKSLADPGKIPVSSTLTPKETEDYILRAFSSGLSEADLSSLSEPDLLLLRTGLYAISGLEFQDASDLAVFFGSFSWYSPNSDDSELVRSRFNSSQSATLECIEKLLQSKN